MYTTEGIYLGLAEGKRVLLPLNMCNRHGLVAGASGTGKTITMKVMAEAFSDAGVPVFLCDVKGDVSGLAAPGEQSEGMEKRIDKFGIRDLFSYHAYPVSFWDIYQTGGHAVRATVSDMGPELLSRILGLTPAQEGVLNIVFKIADDCGLLLYDLKDLQITLNYVREHRAEFLADYGNIAAVSLDSIRRSLIPLEKQGGELFFGEPGLNIQDWMRTDDQGRGVVNLLDCVKLVRNPTLYATFLLWMMSQLFEQLSEVGDLDQPRLVFFFDEAHMLFRNAPKALVEKIEQVVKLIRSKGVGIYFVTQSPSDIPDAVLAQLSHRVQHALRAYTPAEQRAVRAAAGSLRANPAFKSETAIMELGVGEALVSLLDEKGVPGVVQRTAIICPQSLMGPVDDGTRAACIAGDGMDWYDEAIDSVSAYEMLTEQQEIDTRQSALAAERAALEKERADFEAQKAKEAAAVRRQEEKEAEAGRKRREKLEDEERRRQLKLEDEERKRQLRLEDEKRKKAEKEAEAARKKEEKAAAEARKKEEKAVEEEKKKAEKAAERRKTQIERMLISTGGQVLKRGIMNTLFKK